MLTPKQKLLDHIKSEHVRQPPKSYTFADLGKWHSSQHHRFFLSHYHKGSNTGPDDRPKGWKTGEDSVPREGYVR